MPQYRLSPRAERDIEAILEWSHEHFGERGRLRYEALVMRAIFDVAADPDRAGSHARPEITAAARTYHLRHSRDHVSAAIGKVRHPRHFLVYRLLDDGRVEIGRVLHDVVDLKRHLPDEYRARGPDE
ncbi:MAG TPA: type II toxin-antitoxin system RelE/ParE family toxin [Isosphaeraceae bacterium]|nr:type II toxin-antitoxin system RelE/ParE family toxin [Isosphaeraceae bacterium]